MTEKTLRIGTRGSPLALKQASMVENALRQAHPNLQIEIVPIKSAADWKMQDGEISLCDKNGGKGQFAKEIEDKILDGDLDCGVHSLKDMASDLPEGLQISHYLPRADVRDAFISSKATNLMELPDRAVIGTCSPRRKALVLSKRPDIKVVPFRGNVKTRLDKVANAQVDATYLAMAGIERLGIKDPMIHPIDVDAFLPACGQGIICIETRKDDVEISNLFDAIGDLNTALCATAEREVLNVLEGSCHTPIAAFAQFEEGQLYLRAFVASLDGQTTFWQETKKLCQTVQDASAIGLEIGQLLKSELPQGFLQ